jgi:hypothetical protein
MARQGTKRASSSGGKRLSNAVAKKCKTIAATIRHAEGVAQPVRSMVNDRMLLQVFGTFKEERVPFQTTMSELVGSTLKTAQDSLQAKIAEAQASKASEEANQNEATNAGTAAESAKNEAKKAADDARQALDDSHAALKAAKAALHDLEAAGKAAEAEAVNSAAKKEKLAALVKDFFTPLTEGSLVKGLGSGAASAGKLLGKTDMEQEFIVCVVRTFSKASSTWGTFDNLVDQKLADKLKTILANLTSELASEETAKGTRAANVESAKAAVAAAEEKEKAAEEASTAAAAAAKAAAAAAKAAASTVDKAQQQLSKATASLTEAEKAMADFTKGALAAYTEVEDLKPPPPKPVEPASEAAAEPLDAAMTAAPAQDQSRTPTTLPSPGVLFMQAAQGAARAVGLSPRLAQSPR